MLPAIGVGKYVSYIYPIMASLVSEVYVRYVWPCVGTGPLPEQGAGSRISDDTHSQTLPNRGPLPHPRGSKPWTHWSGYVVTLDLT
jgi:hypothetical protein